MLIVEQRTLAINIIETAESDNGWVVVSVLRQNKYHHLRTFQNLAQAEKVLGPLVRKT